MTTTTPVRPSRSVRTLAVVAPTVAALIGAVLITMFGPQGRMSDDRSGDADLIADTEAAIDSPAGLRSLSVGRIDNGATATAGLGDAGAGTPGPATAYELGSITKTFTGMLLADGIERGELTLDDPLARHLPELTDTVAGSITLRALVTHTSGLPTMPSSSVIANLVAGATDGDPYGSWTTARVIDAARTAEVDNPGESSYSNFGIALLGAAQARAASADSWTDLVRERLLDPLGMTETTFEDTPEAFAAPHRSNGWPVSPWVGEGFLPAGTGTRSTVADMLRYAEAIIDSSAPGIAALQPLHRDDDTAATGMAWQIDTDPATGRQILWHNGGTGGSRTMLTIDLEQGRAAIVLGNSDLSVDGIGFRLIGSDGPPTRVETVTTIIGFAILLVAIAAVATAFVRVLRGPTLIAQLSSVAFAIFLSALLLRLGPWQSLPAGIAGILLGVTVGALVPIVAGKLGDRFPTLPPKNRWGAGFDLAISAAMAGLALWAL